MSTATITMLVMEELGVRCERVRVDVKKGETKTPDYLKLNPNGKVPMLVHDGTPIWESAAITLYLGELYGADKKLYPPPGPQRGEAMKWIVWANVTLGDAAHRWLRNTGTWVPTEQHNAKAAEAAKVDMHNCLRMLDQALTSKSFLTGSYTLADTHVNSFVDWLRYSKVDFTPYPALNAWGDRCRARPAYAKVMSESA
jgi:glutathione S-transferase